jgi:cyclic di-GMP phosphodiesterase
MPDSLPPTLPANTLQSVLIVDDNRVNVKLLHKALEGRGYELLGAHDGVTAIEIAREQRPALILLDIVMPDMDGYAVCRRLKALPETRDISIIFLSALDDMADKVKGLELGAVDYIVKPFHLAEVKARVETHLTVHRLREQVEQKNLALQEMTDHLQGIVQERTAALLRSRDAVIFGFAKLAESRDGSIGEHLERICSYVELLARELAVTDAHLDEEWVRAVSTTAALHDVGKVGVPDSVLLKPGPLDEAERKLMDRHASIGGVALMEIKRRWGDDTFLATATDIALSHHERWDGTGYPKGLIGEEIPLAARIVALADVYDALTSGRVYKEAITHEKVREIIIADSGKQFDPAIVQAFIHVEDQFRAVEEQHPPTHEAKGWNDK